jgi:anti-sigma factor RsiW
MNEADYEALVAVRSRRRLSAEEEARVARYLQAHPERRADWELETELTRLLSRLPDAPVPATFATQVLQAVRRDARTDKGAVQPMDWMTWLSAHWRAAGATLAAAAAVLVWQGWPKVSDAPDGVATPILDHIAALPTPEALQDFQAIHHLSYIPAEESVDLELLAALQ